MSISLVKGQKIELTKNIEGLDYLHIGVDWKTLSSLDIDVSAFLLGADGKIVREDDFIFYGQPQSSNQSVRLEESVSTIENQRFIANLSNIPDEVKKISFTLTIYEAKLKNLTFSDVKEIKLRIISSKLQEEIAVFPINYTFTKESAIVLGTLYRYSGEWKFHAVGAGFYGGLADLCQEYGLDVIEENETSSQQHVSSSPNDRFQIVQERDAVEKGEAIPPQSIEHLGLTRSPLVQFDQNRIAELSQQSTNLVQLFEEQVEPNQKPVVRESNISATFDLFDDTAIDQEGFMEALTETEEIFLTRLTNGRIPVSEANLFFRENLTMPAVFLNGINEKASEYLGENLLLEHKEVVLIDEEFSFVIEKVKERSGNEY